jgi:hypothetical protein
VVGLAIGFGALFANFEWEHHSQLAASGGSLFFMIVSIGLVFLNLVPIAALIFISAINASTAGSFAWQEQAASAACVILICYLNFAVARWSLSLGERALAPTA